MASTVLTGIPKIFIMERKLTGAEVDTALDDTTPNLPNGVGVGKANWRQVMFSDGNGAKITLPKNVKKLRTGPEGVRKIIQDRDDGPTLGFDLADISLWNMMKLLGLTGGSLTAKSQAIRSKYGTDLSAAGLPILVYWAEYDPTNETDLPKFGAGACPTAFLFFSGTVENAQEFPISNDQTIIPVQMACTTQAGTTETAAYGAFPIDLTAVAGVDA